MVVFFIVLIICILYAIVLYNYIKKHKNISEKVASIIIMSMLALCALSFVLIYFFVLNDKGITVP